VSAEAPGSAVILSCSACWLLGGAGGERIYLSITTVSLPWEVAPFGWRLRASAHPPLLSPSVDGTWGTSVAATLRFGARRPNGLLMPNLGSDAQAASLTER
jgi:hypothetical protein